ncbi:aminoacyl-tRNA hydrolase [Verrucomicrobiaceae bacterium 227]
MTHLKAIVGLGNPGEKYLRTRHNVGFRILDVLADKTGGTFKFESKWESKICLMDGIALIQPQTFMNESGRAIGSISRFYQWKPEEILVVFDDVSLPLGHLRFRLNGGHGGHNGVRSLLAHLPSDAFPRLKVGIGDASGEQLVGHVLGNFAVAERELLENTLARAADAVQLAASDGIEKAANEFNTRSQKKPKTQLEDESQVRGPDCPEHPGDGQEH